MKTETIESVYSSKMKIVGLILGALLTVSAYSAQTGFLFFGDAGTGLPNQYKVAKSMVSFCEVNPCDFVTLLGDNFYPNGVKSVKDPLWRLAFELPYQNFNIPFFSALGNHDYKGDVESQIQYSKKSEIWKMPARYYQFSRGDIDFFVLDTNRFDGKQKSWLKESLNHSQRPWRIVIGHHPIYSYGGHGDTKELKEELLPMIEGKVDFYLCGHDHNKQVIRKKSSNITYVVSGAGAQIDPLKRNRGALYASASLGFAHLLVSPDTAILKILDENGDTDYSQIFELN